MTRGTEIITVREQNLPGFVGPRAPRIFSRKTRDGMTLSHPAPCLWIVEGRLGTLDIASVLMECTVPERRCIVDEAKSLASYGSQAL